LLILFSLGDSQRADNIRAAFHAYADTHKKRIIVRDERGNEVGATNYSVEDLRKLDPINAFEVADENDCIGNA
jgi:hypothetical protein